MDELGRWGVRHVEFDQTGPPPDGVDLVWVEAPSNPFLTMPDLDAAAAHPAPRRRRLHRCDPDPPSSAGARRRLRRSTAATKYLGGHDDALVGAVVCRDADTHERLGTFRQRTGPISAPDVAWLLSAG